MVPSVWVVAAAVPAVLLASALIYFLTRRKVTPEEKERQRRLAVNASGRITDGLITEIRTVETPTGGASHLLHFSYTLSGVTYSAAQDITTLLTHINRAPHGIIGPASVKYLPGNPSNSIVICERWSGITGITVPPMNAGR